MAGWQRTLMVVGTSQFLSIMGFSFALPFAPFYIQSLGVTDPAKIKFWVAVFGAAAPLSLAVFAPIWGSAADRYGRRLMLLRANFGAVVFLALMGTVHSVGMLIVVRALQGVLTGTMTAAQTLVCSQTPQERSGFALGTLSAGVFSGSMAGAFVGGIFADQFGYRRAFFLSSLILLVAALLILFGTTEAFVRPVPAAPQARRRRLDWDRYGWLLPAMLLVGAVSLCRRFDGSFLPLLVQELLGGGLEGAARWSGALFAVSSVAGFASGLAMGHLADRVHPARLASAAALLAGLCMLPQAYAQGLAVLFAARFGVAFFAGGMEPVFQAWLARLTPASAHGRMFGWLATVRALGWVAAPVASGVVAATSGIRAVFIAGAFLFFALAAATPWVVRRVAPPAGQRVSAV